MRISVFNYIDENFIINDILVGFILCVHKRAKYHLQCQQVWRFFARFWSYERIAHFAKWVKNTKNAQRPANKNGNWQHTLFGGRSQLKKHIFSPLLVLSEEDRPFVITSFGVMMALMQPLCVYTMPQKFLIIQQLKLGASNSSYITIN